jgi:hypothetical protein
MLPLSHRCPNFFTFARETDYSAAVSVLDGDLKGPEFESTLSPIIFATFVTLFFIVTHVTEKKDFLIIFFIAI